MKPATILLVDNGSLRPESVLNLREIAQRLADKIARPIVPVSLQHADKIPSEALHGIPADTLRPLLRHQLSQGERHFILLPLFFGPSRALSSLIPQHRERLALEFGAFELTLAPELCPLPQGEPRLAQILCDQLPDIQTEQQRIILVDHGSTIPAVTAVRHYLAAEMRQRLNAQIQLREAVMERRKGSEYDFNGDLLEQVLRQAGQQDHQTPIALACLFLLPGRHAGKGGDIESICHRVNNQYPNWPIHMSGLVGEHRGLIPILCDRLASVTKPPIPISRA
jgi:sirohydrochlorin ferrochelatase